MQEPLRSLGVFTLVAAGWLTVTGPAAGQAIVGQPYPASITSPGPGPGGPPALWEHELVHPGATYIAMHFRRFDLEPGAVLWVSDAESDQAYAMEGRGKLDAGTFWARHVKGDRVMLRLIRPRGDTRSIVEIDEYVAGFVALEGLEGARAQNAVRARAEHPHLYLRSRAVARLLVNGRRFCTGWLASADGHVLTCEHCIASPADALNTDFEFMAETPRGDSPNLPMHDRGTVFSGATFVRANHDLDYALVRIAEGSPSALFGFLTISTRNPRNGDRIALPHHPGGRAKEIALSDDHPSNPGSSCFIFSTALSACNGRRWLDIGYFVETEKGSSGAPVLDRDSGEVIALHHCGSSFGRGVPMRRILPEIAEAIGLRVDAREGEG